jgi:hypothetical protein
MRYFICRYLITFVNGCNFGWRVYKSMHAEYHWWVDWGLFWVKDDQGAMVSTSASWRQSVLYVPDHFHNEPLRWRGSDLQVNGHIICLSTMGDLEQKILTPLGNEVQCFNLHSCITTILALHGSPLILVPGISGWIFSLRAKWPPVLYVINSHKLLAFPICHFLSFFSGCPSKILSAYSHASGCPPSQFYFPQFLIWFLLPFASERALPPTRPPPFLGPQVSRGLSASSPTEAWPLLCLCQKPQTGLCVLLVGGSISGRPLGSG